MPVSVLLVEGDLDAQILKALVGTSPASPEIVIGGSKGGLRPETRRARGKGIQQYYLRDRDFDYEFPPQVGGVSPMADRPPTDGVVLGWRWCLHEIENYLLIPALVALALGCEEIDYRQALMQAARSIRSYQAARWAVGTTRAELAKCRILSTRPAGSGGDFDLPDDLSEPSQLGWAEAHLASHFNQYKRQLKGKTTRPLIGRIAPHFGPAFPASEDDALRKCSGKNLMAALGSWLLSQGIQHPSVFRSRMRDWVIDHTEDALHRVPEWNGLVQLVVTS